MIKIFLLLGSNLGHRELFLKTAIGHIENDISPVLISSSVYETQSWGKTDLPDYLNQVIMVQTEMTAETLLGKILTIETVMGRERIEKWGSRIIDIDILFYGDAVIERPGLIIPHPELHKRRFTLEPMSEIGPDFIHPVFNKTIGQLKNELNDNLIIKKVYF